MRGKLFLCLGEAVAFHDQSAFPAPTIRHVNCELLLCNDEGEYCLKSDQYRYIKLVNSLFNN